MAERWPNSLLEPVLITFNRAHQLERTLEQFRPAFELGLRFHVLDNASTDATPEVVARFQRQYPGIVGHRNPLNIGGNANIVRAVEITSSTYHWVLGDDDAWHLDDLGELLGVLSKETADVIRLGWLVGPGSAGKWMRLSELEIAEPLFYPSCSMISSLILRRSLVADSLRHAYQSLGDFAPQLTPLLRSNASDLQIYSLSLPLVTHTPAASGYLPGDFTWLAAWFRNSAQLANPARRRRLCQSLLHYEGRHLNSMWAGVRSGLRIALHSRAFGRKQGTLIGDMLLHGAGVRFVVLLFGLAYALPPQWLAWMLFRAYYRLTYGRWISRTEAAPLPLSDARL